MYTIRHCLKSNIVTHNNLLKPNANPLNTHILMSMYNKRSKPISASVQIFGLCTRLGVFFTFVYTGHLSNLVITYWNEIDSTGSR